MTEQEFKELCHKTRLTEKSILVAKAVLVDGLPKSTAAEQHGFTRQRVQTIINSLLSKKYPKNWVQKSLYLPPELCDEFNALEKKSKQLLKQQKNTI